MNDLLESSIEEDGKDDLRKPRPPKKPKVEEESDHEFDGLLGELGKSSNQPLRKNSDLDKAQVQEKDEEDEGDVGRIESQPSQLLRALQEEESEAQLKQKSSQSKKLKVEEEDADPMDLF